MFPVTHRVKQAASTARLTLTVATFTIAGVRGHVFWNHNKTQSQLGAALSHDALLRGHAVFHSSATNHSNRNILSKQMRAETIITHLNSTNCYRTLNWMLLIAASLLHQLLTHINIDKWHHNEPKVTQTTILMNRFSNFKCEWFKHQLRRVLINKFIL